MLEKTVLLHNSLNKEELRLLENLVKVGPVYHYRIYNLCRDKKSKGFLNNKDFIFRKILLSPYSKSKDDNFRQIISSYNQKIKIILAQQFFENDEEIQLFLYLKAIKEKGLLRVWESDLKLAIRNKAKKGRLESVDLLYRQLLCKEYVQPKYTLNELTVIEKEVHEAFSFLNKIFLEKRSGYKLIFYYLQRVKQQLTQNNDIQKIDLLDVSFDEYDITEKTYKQDLTAEAYLASGQKKIEYLKKVIELIAEKRDSQSNIERFSAFQNLGIEYMIIGEITIALEYIEKTIHLKENIARPSYYASLLNFISILCKLGKFEEANRILDANPDLLEFEPMKTRIIPLSIAVFLLNNEIKKAEELMPHNLKEGANDSYHYFRILQAIVHIENKNYDMAINELKNILRHLKTYKLNEEINITRVISQSLILYSNYFLRLDKDIYISKAKKIISSYKINNKSFSSNSLLFIWTEKKINDYKKT